ncbi:MAG: hypothetical protein OEL53_00600 [Rhodospirillales bacterium]|nr:hypothetical protein [Rhodospirillales bacterium]
MSYNVIKWVKGYPYLYRQTSRREGKSVRTESVFLGSANSPSGQTGTPTETVSARLTIAANVSGATLSQGYIRYHYSEAARMLRQIGIEGEKLPLLAVRLGSRLGVKLGKQGDYVLTLPSTDEANRSEVRTAFHLALAEVCLAALREQQPERHAALSLHMEQSFRATNAAVIRYVSNSRHQATWAWAICLRLFGIAHPVAVRGKAIDPALLGLVQYGKRGQWQEETLALLGKVLANGFDTCWQVYLRERAKAETAESKAAQDYHAASLLARPAAKRKWHRTQARIGAQAEMGEKLVTLRAVFGLA